MREENEAVQLVCPKWCFKMTVYAPLDNLPRCPECSECRMFTEELLDEGKAY